MKRCLLLTEELQDIAKKMNISNNRVLAITAVYQDIYDMDINEYPSVNDLIKFKNILESSDFENVNINFSKNQKKEISNAEKLNNNKPLYLDSNGEISLLYKSFLIKNNNNSAIAMLQTADYINNTKNTINSLFVANKNDINDYYSKKSPKYKTEKQNNNISVTRYSSTYKEDASVAKKKISEIIDILRNSEENERTEQSINTDYNESINSKYTFKDSDFSFLTPEEHNDFVNYFAHLAIEVLNENQGNAINVYNNEISKLENTKNRTPRENEVLSRMLGVVNDISNGGRLSILKVLQYGKYNGISALSNCIYDKLVDFFNKELKKNPSLKDKEFFKKMLVGVFGSGKKVKDKLEEFKNIKEDDEKHTKRNNIIKEYNELIKKKNDKELKFYKLLQEAMYRIRDIEKFNVDLKISYIENHLNKMYDENGLILDISEMIEKKSTFIKEGIDNESSKEDDDNDSLSDGESLLEAFDGSFANAEEISQHDSVSATTRRILYNCYEIDPTTGKPLIGESSLPKFRNPSDTHKTILDLCHKSQDIKQMMDSLEKNKTNYPWIKQIIKTLRTGDNYQQSLIQSALFTDIKKQFNFYQRQDIKRNRIDSTLLSIDKTRDDFVLLVNNNVKGELNKELRLSYLDRKDSKSKEVKGKLITYNKENGTFMYNVSLATELFGDNFYYGKDSAIRKLFKQYGLDSTLTEETANSKFLGVLDVFKTFANILNSIGIMRNDMVNSEYSLINLITSKTHDELIIDKGVYTELSDDGKKIFVELRDFINGVINGRTVTFEHLNSNADSLFDLLRRLPHVLNKNSYIGVEGNKKQIEDGFYMFGVTGNSIGYTTERTGDPSEMWNVISKLFNIFINTKYENMAHSGGKSFSCFVNPGATQMVFQYIKNAEERMPEWMSEFKKAKDKLGCKNKVEYAKKRKKEWLLSRFGYKGEDGEYHLADCYKVSDNWNNDSVKEIDLCTNEFLKMILKSDNPSFDFSIGTGNDSNARGEINVYTLLEHNGKEYNKMSELDSLIAQITSYFESKNFYGTDSKAYNNKMVKITAPIYSDATVFETYSVKEKSIDDCFKSLVNPIRQEFERINLINERDQYARSGNNVPNMGYIDVQRGKDGTIKYAKRLTKEQCPEIYNGDKLKKNFSECDCFFERGDGGDFKILPTLNRIRYNKENIQNLISYFKMNDSAEAKYLVEELSKMLPSEQSNIEELENIGLNHSFSYVLGVMSNNLKDVAKKAVNSTKKSIDYGKALNLFVETNIRIAYEGLKFKTDEESDDFITINPIDGNIWDKQLDNWENKIGLIDSPTLRKVMNKKIRNWATSNMEIYGGEKEVIKNLLKLFDLNTTYWNSQLTNLMTNDIAFYGGQVDFQKRFKETYSPTRRFDTNAVDKNGNKVSDGIERYLILKDNKNVIANAWKRLFYKKKVSKINDNNEYETVEILSPSEDLLKQVLSNSRLSEADRAIFMNTVTSAYNNVNETDAQAYRSLESYRKLMIMQGKDRWTDIQERAYRRFTGKTNEMWTMDDFLTIYQTIKGFGFGTYMLDMGVNGKHSYQKVPMQNKNSELMLMSSLLVAGSLRAEKSPILAGIHKFMSENDIDVVEFHSAQKVGNTMEVDMNINSIRKILNTDKPKLSVDDYVKYLEKVTYVDKIDGMSINDYYNGIDNKLKNDPIKGHRQLKNGYIKSVSYQDYGIQVETPEHFIDKYQAIGSQLKKLIMTNLNKDGKYVVNGKEYTPSELKMHYQKLLTANIIDSFGDLTEEFESTLDENGKIKKSSVEKLSEALKKEMMSNSRYGTEAIEAIDLLRDEKGNIVRDENGNAFFNLPLFDTTHSLKIQQFILSFVRNRITKQKTAGGTLIQASCFGVSDNLSIRYFDKNGFLIWNNDEFSDQSTLSPTQKSEFDRFMSTIGVNEKIVQVDDKGNKTYNYNNYMKYISKMEKDGYVKKMAWMECYVPCPSRDMLKTLINTYGGSNFKKTGVIDISTLDDDIRKMIGYRVPTEDLYSMCPLYIKGFLPYQNGSAIMVPSEITTLAGSDFDVDKMYIMRKEFLVVENTLKKKNKLRDIIFSSKTKERFIGTEFETTYKNATTKIDSIILALYKDELSEIIKNKDKEGFAKFKEDVMNRINDVKSKIKQINKDNKEDSKKDKNKKYTEITKATDDITNDSKLTQLYNNIDLVDRSMEIMMKKVGGDNFVYGDDIYTPNINSLIDDGVIEENDKEYLKNFDVKKINNKNIKITNNKFKKILRNNELIDIIHDVLTNENSFDRFIKPGGFDTHQWHGDIIRLAELNNLPVYGDYFNMSEDVNYNVASDVEKTRMIIKKILSNPEEFSHDKLDNIISRFSPLSFSPIGSHQRAYLHFKNMEGKNLLAISAVNSSCHSLMEAFINNDNGNSVNIVVNPNKHSLIFEYNNRNLNIVNGQVAQDYADTSMNDKYGLNIAGYITNNNAGYIAAAADNAKTPCLGNLGANETTINEMLYMTRLGYTPIEIGALMKQPVIQLLCNMVGNGELRNVSIGLIKKAIKRYIKNKENATNKKSSTEIFLELKKMSSLKSFNNNYYSESDNEDDIIQNDAMNEIYESELKDDEIQKLSEEVIRETNEDKNRLNEHKIQGLDSSLENMIYNLNSTTFEFQLRCLELFQKISSAAKAMNKLSTALRFDTTNGTAKNVFSLDNIINKFEEALNANDFLIEREVIDDGEKKKEYNKVLNDMYNFKKYFEKMYGENGEMINEDTYLNWKAFKDDLMRSELPMLNAYYFCGIQYANTLMEKFFPYHNQLFLNAKRHLEMFNGGYSLNEKQFDALCNGIIEYKLSQLEFFNNSVANGVKEESTIGRLNFIKDFVNEFREFKKTHKSPLLDFLYEDNNSAGFPVILFNNTGLNGKIERENCYKAWDVMAKNPDTKQFAINLYKYFFYKQGFSWVKNGAGTLAPLSVRSEIPEYRRVLDLIQNSDEILPDDFYSQLIANNFRVFEPMFKEVRYNRKKNVASEYYASVKESELEKFIIDHALMFTKKGLIAENQPNEAMLEAEGYKTLSSVVNSIKIGNYGYKSDVNGETIYHIKNMMKSPSMEDYNNDEESFKKAEEQYRSFINRSTLIGNIVNGNDFVTLAPSDTFVIKSYNTPRLIKIKNYDDTYEYKELIADVKYPKFSYMSNFSDSVNTNNVIGSVELSDIAYDNAIKIKNSIEDALQIKKEMKEKHQKNGIESLNMYITTSNSITTHSLLDVKEVPYKEYIKWLTKTYRFKTIFNNEFKFDYDEKMEFTDENKYKFEEVVTSTEKKLISDINYRIRDIFNNYDTVSILRDIKQISNDFHFYSNKLSLSEIFDIIYSKGGSQEIDAFEFAPLLSTISRTNDKSIYNKFKTRAKAMEAYIKALTNQKLSEESEETNKKNQASVDVADNSNNNKAFLMMKKIEETFKSSENSSKYYNISIEPTEGDIMRGYISIGDLHETNLYRNFATMSDREIQLMTAWDVLNMRSNISNDNKLSGVKRLTDLNLLISDYEKNKQNFCK